MAVNNKCEARHWPGCPGNQPSCHPNRAGKKGAVDMSKIPHRKQPATDTPAPLLYAIQYEQYQEALQAEQTVTANASSPAVIRKAKPKMVRDTPQFEHFARAYLTREVPPTEQKAAEIAALAHFGQTDQNGEDYIDHPRMVVELTTQRPEYARLTPHEQEVARTAGWLHDTLEDTALNHDDLRKAGFSDEIIDVIDSVTSRDGEPKEDYYARVKAGGPVAVAVKLGDLSHNNLPERRETLPGSPSNPCQDGEEDRFTKLGKKYYKAYTELGAEVPAHLRQFAPSN